MSNSIALLCVLDAPPATTEPPKPTGYDFVGEGECRQADGQYGLEFSKSWHDLRPHYEGDNAEKAKDRCLNLCSQYSWCFAAYPILRNIWKTPSCQLVTDRPTFEDVYGVRSTYKWGESTKIDGNSFQTYCAGNGCTAGDNKAMNWNGGKLYPRDDYFCYKKNGRYQH